MSDDKARQLAAQLRRPSGDVAIDTAVQMNRSNEQANLRAIELLGITASNHVLELGPGNGQFAPRILSEAVDVVYAGLDWSQEMVEIAAELNADHVKTGHVSFTQGSSESIPFKDGQFDRVLAVHTVYFWHDVQVHLREVVRVLAPRGRFCVVFGDKAFMARLPFTRYGFTLYSLAAMHAQLNEAGFRVINAETHAERGISNSGEQVDKQLHSLLCEAQ
ncbi:MAG: class I SAM-dependent methyltransferase [Pseudomonadota bacterium]